MLPQNKIQFESFIEFLDEGIMITNEPCAFDIGHVKKSSILFGVTLQDTLRHFFLMVF